MLEYIIFLSVIAILIMTVIRNYENIKSFFIKNREDIKVITIKSKMKDLDDLERKNEFYDNFILPIFS